MNHWDIYNTCLCHCEFSKAVGTHDTITKEWLPDAPTELVRLKPHPDCPWHKHLLLPGGITSCPCAICGVETGEPWERFMLRDALWERAAGTYIGQVLCIGCVEDRLGRKLEPSDFSDVPLNDPIGLGYTNLSERLLDRLGQRASSLC